MPRAALPTGTPSPNPTFVINDFTPGVRQIKSLNHPPGTADDKTADRGKATIGCWASGADGVLRALPKRTNTIKRSAGMVFTANLTSEQYRICGIMANDPVFSSNTVPGIDQNNTEIFVAVEYYDNTPQRVRKVLRYSRHESSPVWEVCGTATAAGAFSSTSRPGRCYFVTSRSNSAAPTSPGVPVTAWAFGGWARSFPSDLAPAVSGTQTIPQDGSGLLPPDMIVGHQNRIVVFPLFQWGDGNNGTVQAHVDNELIYWTAVNNVTTLDPLFGGVYGRVIAYAERDCGYELVHPIANDQLLAIKRNGGGLLLYGDLNDFTAVPLPNIKSPGFSLNIGCVTHLGIMYPTNAGGVWLVEGGRSSRNLSPHMKPDFWRPRAYSPANPTTGPSYLQTANGWGVDYTSCAEWGQWVLFPSNWLLDTETGSWWRLDNTPMSDSGNTDVLGYLESHWWTVDWTGRWAWSAPSGYGNLDYAGNACVVLNEYDRLQARSSFSWLSQPLPFSVDQRVTIDDIRVTMETFDTSAALTAQSVVTVYVLADDPAGSSSVVFTNRIANANGALQTLRGSANGATTGTNLRLYVTSQAGNSSGTYMAEPPRIHRIEVDYHVVTAPARST